MNDKKPLPRYAPKAKDDRTIAPQFWECIALHFAEAHETNFTHGPIDYDNICGKCSFFAKCFAPGASQLDQYWRTANAILFEKSGISCKFLRDPKDFEYPPSEQEEESKPKTSQIGVSVQVKSKELEQAEKQAVQLIGKLKAAEALADVLISELKKNRNSTILIQGL